jgi:hypothetical protein
MINKNNIIIAAVCEKGGTRQEIRGVHFAKDFTEATDTYILIRVEKEEETPLDELPPINGKPLDLEGAIISAEDIKSLKLFKPNKKLPILDNIVLSNETPEKIEMTVTDLSNTHTIRAGKIAGIYPDTDVAMFDKIEGGESITLDLLKKMIDVLYKMDIESMRIEISNQTVKMQGTTPQGQDVKAILATRTS